MSVYWNDFLVHGGPGSGRYPKGSGERPRALRGGLFSRRKAKKKEEALAKAKAHEIKKRESNEIDNMDAATLSSNVKRAKQSGDINEIRKYQKHMTNQELKDAIDRIDLNRKVSEIGKKDKGAIAAKNLQKAGAMANDVKDILVAGAASYNAVLNIKKMLSTHQPTNSNVPTVPNGRRR